MDATELRELFTPDALTLLDSIPPWDSSADVVKTVAALRKAGHAPGTVAAVLS